MSTGPIRVLVADDHSMTRRGVATLLLAFSDILLVGEAHTGAEALALCETAKPEVVLMDLLMPEMDGVTATHAIRERYPDIQVIVLTSMDEYELVQRALAAGAGDLLVKNMSGDEMASKIRRAGAGRMPQLPLTVEVIVQTVQPDVPALSHQEVELTERERAVLTSMAHSLTNPQIGAELAISRGTVKLHVSAILAKFGVTSRTEAVARAVEMQLIKLLR